MNKVKRKSAVILWAAFVVTGAATCYVDGWRQCPTSLVNRPECVLAKGGGESGMDYPWPSTSSSGLENRAANTVAGYCAYNCAGYSGFELQYPGASVTGVTCNDGSGS